MIKRLIAKLKWWLAYLLVAIAVVLVFMELGLSSITPWLLLISLLVYFAVSQLGRCSTFLVWDDACNTGIDQLDEDHKKLLNMINNLRSSTLCNTGEEFERCTLQELVDYTESHFDREERLMQEHGYPDYEGHKAQHDQMAQYVAGFVKRYDEQGNKVLPDVADHLTRWLIQHIKGTDMKYVEFFKQEGVN
jgi:hemerythrin